MKLAAIRHPKTLDLASRLGVKRPSVIGHLELLWAFAAEYAPQGDVGKFSDGTIAGACDWEGDSSAFTSALTSAGYLDRDSVHRLVIHDWEDHAQGWVRAKLKKTGQAFISADGLTSVASSEATSEPTSEASREASPRARVPSQAKPSLAKPSPTTAAARPAEPPEFGELKALYPKRAGSNPWPRALKACKARIREGHSWQEILGGVCRYSEFIRATGKAETEFVLQAATFCGPDKRFLETWDPPASVAQRAQDMNVESGREWLRRSASA